MAVENDPGFWEQAFRWAWAVTGGLLVVIWHMLNSKINGKASRESVDTLTDEMTRQRDHVSKIFDELRDVRKELNDSHNRIMEAIHNNFPGRR